MMMMMIWCFVRESICSSPGECGCSRRDRDLERRLHPIQQVITWPPSMQHTYLSTYLSIYLSIYLSTSSIHPSIYPSIYLSIHINRSIHIYLSIIYPSPIYHLSVFHQSVYHLSIHYLSMHVHMQGDGWVFEEPTEQTRGHWHGLRETIFHPTRYIL